MADTSEMIRKIQACLALADDPAATTEEKIAAKTAAAKLMAKYEISEALLFVSNRDKGGDKAKDVVLTSFFISGSEETFIPLQRQQLATVIGRSMNCRAVIERKEASADVETGAPLAGGVYLSLVGFRSDVESARGLYQLLVMDIAMAIARERQKSVNYTRQFAEGYVERIHTRLESLRATVTRAVKEQDSSMALVLVNKKEIVDDKFAEMYPNLRYVDRKVDSRRDDNARVRGAKAANNANLGGKSVGGGERKGLGY